MEFEKKNNRYLLNPRKRILKIVKHEKEISISKLQRESKMQFDVLKKYLEQIEKEKLIKVKEDRVIDEDRIVSISRTIKWVNKKNGI